MTLREMLADFISGGAVDFYKSGWDRSSALYCRAKADAEWFQESLRSIEEATRNGKSGTARKVHRMATEALK